jgi:hypothetical protein
VQKCNYTRVYSFKVYHKYQEIKNKSILTIKYGYKKYVVMKEPKFLPSTKLIYILNCVTFSVSVLRLANVFVA